MLQTLKICVIIVIRLIFFKAVRKAREYEPSRDDLIILPGGPVSHIMRL